MRGRNEVPENTSYSRMREVHEADILCTYVWYVRRVLRPTTRKKEAHDGQNAHKTANIQLTPPADGRGAEASHLSTAASPQPLGTQCRVGVHITRIMISSTAVHMLVVW